MSLTLKLRAVPEVPLETEVVRPDTLSGKSEKEIAALPLLYGNRRVELGKVHFNLFKGPGFSVDSVIIHEDPAIGAEPIVYILQGSGSLEVAPVTIGAAS